MKTYSRDPAIPLNSYMTPTTIHVVASDTSVIVYETGDESLVEALTSLPLDEMKKLKVSELSQICHEAIVSGFTSSALGTPHVYDSTPEDQLNLEGLSRYAERKNTSVPYRCCPEGSEAKTYIVHTPAQLDQVVTDGIAFKSYLLHLLETRRQEIDACTTIAEVEAISW